MITTVPNLLTLSRIAAIPFVAGALYWDHPWSGWLAGLLFAAAAATDLFDGLLARRRDEVSEFGRMVDPIADKLLVTGVLMILVSGGVAPLLPAVVIVLREILVSGVREFLAARQASLPVTRLAKWKTAAQMVAITTLLVGGPLLGVGEVLLWLAAALTVVTGYDYLRIGVGRLTAAPPSA